MQEADLSRARISEASFTRADLSHARLVGAEVHQATFALANLFFLYGTASYLASLGHNVPWHLGSHIPTWISDICRLTFGIAILQAGVRARSGARIYGWPFAAAVPIRMFWGNLVNFAATATALWEFSKARSSGRGLAWRKTDHVYPLAQPAVATAVVGFRPLVDASANARIAESY
jgi:adsorption protein B